MARSRTCRSLRRNFFLGGEDEFAKGPPRASTKSSNTSTLSPAISRAPTLAPAPVPAPLSIDKLFKQFIKAYLESNRGPSQPPTERKQLFKAKMPDIYYGKLHIDCYHFCQ